MKDKIIQILEFKNKNKKGEDNSYGVMGLSASGSIYLWLVKTPVERTKMEWIKLVDSPLIDERKKCDKCKKKSVNILKRQDKNLCKDCYYYEQT